MPLHASYTAPSLLLLHLGGGRGLAANGHPFVREPPPTFLLQLSCHLGWIWRIKEVWLGFAKLKALPMPWACCPLSQLQLRLMRTDAAEESLQKLKSRACSQPGGHGALHAPFDCTTRHGLRYPCTQPRRSPLSAQSP